MPAVNYPHSQEMPKNFKPGTERVQVKIPLKPYQRRFLVNGNFMFNCRFLSTADYIGKYLTKLLESKRNTTNEPLRIRERDYVIIDVAIRNPRKYVTDSVIIDFQSYLNGIIKDEFMKELIMLGPLTKTMGLHDCVYHFRAKYELPNEELSFDALIKHYQRRKNNYKQLANYDFQKNKRRMSSDSEKKITRKRRIKD